MALVQQRLVVAGRELEVERIGARRAGRPVLVFLHEGLGSIALWRGFPAALADRTGYEAVVYSRYGNGFSAPLTAPRTARYMHDEGLVALPDLLDRLEIEDCVIVGHSDGASIGLIYAAMHPDRVRALVVEAPHIFVEELSVASIAAIKTEFEGGDLRGRMARYHHDGDRTFYGWNEIWLSPEFRDWNIEVYLDRLRAPLLAIQGLDDKYGTLAQLEIIARKAPVPVDRLLLARCGHAPHLDRPRIVEMTIAGWLEELTAVPAPRSIP